MRLLTTRNFIILVTILITSYLAVWGLYYSRVLEPEATVELIPDNVDLTLKNIKYTKTLAGEPLWTLVADSAQSTEDGITRIKNIRMVFFDRENGDIELSADEGALIPEHKTVTVSSNVVVVSSPGNTLQTDYLRFEEATQLLQTDGMVKINRDHFIVSGKGMELNIIERTLVLLSDVQAQLAGMDSI
ncbi:MAG: LPS export ABC transporter periplasmic protein LptC [Desulfobulbaceae bacterium]|nr:LPS export ABC transporter periplasmic protein LptC [Desulfobulbaceae bacterium]